MGIAHATTNAADLKFLHHLRQVHRNFKSKSGIGNHKVASAPLLPKFVPGDAARYHELRKRGTSAGWLSGGLKTAPPGDPTSGAAYNTAAWRRTIKIAVSKSDI